MTHSVAWPLMSSGYMLPSGHASRFLAFIFCTAKSVSLYVYRVT